MTGVWREPAAESTDLYPGLVVHDDRHCGSITIGPSRLPLNAIVPDAIDSDWAFIERNWLDGAYDWDQKQMTAFLYDLLEVRGEFARLLLVLANVERNEPVNRAWWEIERRRNRVVAQLRACLAVLEVKESAS